MPIAKLKEFPGVQKLAPETIEKHDIAQALQDAAFAFETQLFDLRAEFIHRENKLRADYLQKGLLWLALACAARSKKEEQWRSTQKAKKYEYNYAGKSGNKPQ